MTTTVLAYIPSPAQGVWHLGPIPIRAYALCIIAGIIVAMLIGDRRWVARGGQQGVIYDIAIWAVPFGLIGGRLYHLMTDWKTYFGPGGAGIGAAARIWEGGLGIWGAVALGGVGAWIACRRRGIPLPAFGDAVAPGIILAQAIGRLGNYFNQELYGRETTVPWGLEIFYRRDPSGVVDVHSLDGVSTGQVAAVVHPTFLYEMIWNLLVFVILLWADRKFRLGHGRLFALYVALYCVGRFWIELMRDDAATHIAGIRINVFTSMFVFIGAVVYMLLAPKGREDPATLRGKAVQTRSHDALTEELVAVASGSGIVAAATVAGEHETEDAIAVGDVVTVEDGGVVVDGVTAAAESTEELEEAAAEAAIEEAAEEAAAEEPGAGVEHGDDDESTVVVYASEPETGTVVVYESEDEVAADTTVVVSTVDAESESETAVHVVTVDAQAEAAEAEAVETEAVETEAVETEATAPEATEAEAVEAEAVEEKAEVEADAEAEADVEADVEAETEAEADAAVEAAAESDVEVEAEADADAEADAEVVVVQPEPEPEEATEAEAETPAAPEAPAAVKTVQDPVAENAGNSDHTDDTEAPKLGSTFKRLLFGAGGRD